MRRFLRLNYIGTRYQIVCTLWPDDPCNADGARFSAVLWPWMQDGCPGLAVFRAWGWMVHYLLWPVRRFHRP